MNQQIRSQIFREYVNRIAPDMLDNMSTVLEGRTNTEVPEEFIRSGMDQLASGQDLSIAQSVSLEAIVHEHYRPAVFIVGNTYRSPPYPWASLADDGARQRIESAILGVGRVEVPQRRGAPSYAGTAFRVGADLLMTNRHVAEIFSRGLGTSHLGFRASWSAGVNFRKEVMATPEVNDLQVSEVVMIHPNWDMALLRVTGMPVQEAMQLSTVHPDDLAGRNIVVIGYPAFDPRNDTDLQNRIFGGVFGVKRLQPGKVDSRRVVESFGNEVNALGHDASTLGGNSGSVVMDVDSGEVVGLHFGGLYLDANFAVPSYELARDRRVVDTGINFNGSVEPTSDWASRWRAADSLEKESSVANSVNQATVQPPGSGGISSPPVLTSGSGNSVSVTIPLTITVSLGGGSGQAVELASSDRQTPSESTTESAQSSDAIIAQARSLADSTQLGSGTLNHRAALAGAVLSELAYHDGTDATASTVKALGFDTCEFVNRNDTQCFIASNNRLVVVSFRGSEVNIGDWVSNFRALRVSTRHGSVHAGFLHGFLDAKEQIEQELMNVSASGKQLMLTGHSLGGALTLIAAAEWREMFPVAEIYTFGQPAVGGKGFRKSMQDFADRYSRYVHRRDIVARIPPLYRHIKGRIKLPMPLQESAFGESMDDDDMLTEAQFNQLQGEVSGESMLEGPLDPFTDHKLVNYIAELSRRVGDLA